MVTNYEISDIRNVAIVGHGASGKTSLVDAFLYVSGATVRRGSVDDGTSLSDIDDEEKRRKITIDCHLLHVKWNNKQFHLIDSPGYPDFIAGAISALVAVENVVVAVSAPHGPGVNTRRVYQEATKLGLGRIIALTKMDADNVDFTATLNLARETFGTHCVPFDIPVGEGPTFSGIINVLEPPDAEPAGCPLPLKEARRMLVEQIVETDEALMNRYLEGETLTADELKHAAHEALAKGLLVPIMCVSTRKDIGVRELLDFLDQCGLEPGEVKRVTMHGLEPDNLEEIPIVSKADTHVVAQVFKTTNDMFMGKLAYLRVHSGRITKDSTLVNVRTGKTSKPGHLYVLQGGTKEEVSEVIAGDIVVIAKFDDLHVSDTVTLPGSNVGHGHVHSHGHGHGHGDPEADLSLKPISFPTPMVPLAVHPKTREDEAKISANLAKIADEDPTFTYRRDPQTNELVMTGMSELHLEVIQSRLKQRYKLEMTTHVPHVPYLETILGSAESQHRHKKQTGGRGQFADVHLRIRPLPRGEGFKFVDAVKGGVIPNQYIPAVEKGVKEQMEKGVITGNKVVDVEVEVFFGSYHDVDSSEQAFKIAAATAFRKAFVAAQPSLLEPVVTLDVVAPLEKFGDVSADLSTRRGHITGMESLPGNQQSLKASAPLAEVLTYATSLKSMTGGQGSFSMDLHGYEPVPAMIQHKLVEKYQKSRQGIEED